MIPVTDYELVHRLKYGYNWPINDKFLSENRPYRFRPKQVYVTDTHPLQWHNFNSPNRIEAEDLLLYITTLDDKYDNKIIDTSFTPDLLECDN